MDSLTDRVDALEQAVLGLAIQTFGDAPGHDFHGNQYTGGGGGSGDGPRARAFDAANTPEARAAYLSAASTGSSA